MGGPQSAQPATRNRPAGSEALVLLAGSASAAERALVARWLRDGHLRPSAVLPLDGPDLARSLDRAVPETVVTAVRVAWLPRERGGERRVRWSDVLSQVNPQRPPAFWQNRIMRREPDRARIVVAEPATVAALRDRWGGTDSFAQFVSRQARLALDRSERALLGYRYKVPKEVTGAIEDSPHFRAEVARLAARLGLTEQEAMGRAEADLDSLVASMSPIAVDLLSNTLRPLARRAGIVFIRRSFGDDEIYKLALREYLGFLLAKRFNLEWYMEGGRSRTGKLRPPRYGLLAYVAEAVARGRAEDACLVPVAITYDQLREVSAMAAEQAGAAKKPEGLGWLAAYARGQLARIGTVHVRFAEPISLGAALPPDGPDGDKDAWRLALQKVAFEVAVRINQVTPVTATALVTLALLGVRDRALTLGQVRGVLEPLRGYLAERRMPYSLDILDTDAGVQRVLGALSQQNVVTIYAGGEEPVYAIERGQHLVAAFYRNSAIHHFLDRAVAELVMLSAPANRLDEGMRMRDQLKFEFFFPDKTAYRAVLRAELDRLDPGWETVADGRVVLERSDLLVANRVLRSFLDAQLVVAERLAARPPHHPVAEKEFLDECRGVGQQMLLQGRLHGPESLSRELFASALKLAANLDLLGPGGDDLAQRRRAFAGRLHEDVARLILIDEIDAAGRREAIGVEP
jgi:glycerol-3-phosphate O-acyltransferase